MTKTSLTIAALSLASSLSFAKPVANMQVICAETVKQEIVRIVYLSDDKSVLIADPFTHLLLVDNVQQPSEDIILLKSATANGSESLQIKNTGDAILVITNGANIENLNMKCLSSDKKSIIDLTGNWL